MTTKILALLILPLCACNFGVDVGVEFKGTKQPPDEPGEAIMVIEYLLPTNKQFIDLKIEWWGQAKTDSNIPGETEFHFQPKWYTGVEGNIYGYASVKTQPIRNLQVLALLMSR